MKIIIKNRSDVPIYEQIEEQIKAQILEGKTEENEQLPSIRQLARDLKISAITTTRVYNDLADEGFIVSVTGKGFFVAPRNNDGRSYGKGRGKRKECRTFRQRDS